MSFEIINPESLGAPKGWNHGMLAPAGGRVLFVAGQDARDESGEITADGVVDQFARALERILVVVREAGGKPENVGLMLIYVTDIEAYRSSLTSIGVAYRELMGHHYPAMALVEVKALMDPRALVEIEATAVMP